MRDGRRALDRATTQNNLGIPLGTLWARESGTARREEPVSDIKSRMVSGLLVDPVKQVAARMVQLLKDPSFVARSMGETVPLHAVDRREAATRRRVRRLCIVGLATVTQRKVGALPDSRLRTPRGISAKGRLQSTPPLYLRTGGKQPILGRCRGVFAPSQLGKPVPQPPKYRFRVQPGGR